MTALHLKTNLIKSDKEEDSECNSKSNQFPNHYECAKCDKKFISFDEFIEHWRVDTHAETEKQTNVIEETIKTEVKDECNSKEIEDNSSSTISDTESESNKDEDTDQDASIIEFADDDFDSNDSDYFEQLANVGESDYDNNKNEEECTGNSNKKIKKSAKTVKKIKCSLCKKEIRCSNYKTHRENVHGKTSKVLEATCEICDKTLPNKTSLYNHVNNVHKVNREKVACKICKKMVCSYYMKVHVRINHTNAGKLHKCKICGVDVKFLKNHIKTAHNKKEDLRLEGGCIYCPKILPTTLMSRHLQCVHKTNCSRVKVRCLICSAVVRTNGFKQHLETVHDPDREKKKINCTICEKVFVNEKVLKKHVETVHLCKVPEFDCTLCNRSFKYKNSLKAHVEDFHTALDPIFKCTLCTNIYYDRDILKNHLNTVHGYVFNENDENNWILPTNIESNGYTAEENKLSCVICHHHYNTKYYLKRHMEGAHGIIVNSDEEQSKNELNE